MASAAEPTGQLALATRLGAEGRTEIGRQFHAGALRVMRAHPTEHGRTMITVVNPGGGYLGGDRYELDYAGASGTRTLLTTQSANKVYRSTGADAVHNQRIELEAGAMLDYVPDPLIAYAEARYTQRTTVQLADASAGYFGAEIITPGWSPDGTPFRYERVRLHTRVAVSGAPLLHENLLLRPGATAVGDPAWLGSYTHSASVVIAGAGVDATLLDAVRAACAEAGNEVYAGAGLLSGPGLVVRALSMSTETLTRLSTRLGTLASEARGHSGAEWNLRKY